MGSPATNPCRGSFIAGFRYLKNVANQGWMVIKGAKSAFPSNSWTNTEDGLQVHSRISVRWLLSGFGS